MPASSSSSNPFHSLAFSTFPFLSSPSSAATSSTTSPAHPAPHLAFPLLLPVSSASSSAESRRGPEPLPGARMAGAGAAAVGKPGGGIKGGGGGGGPAFVGQVSTMLDPSGNGLMAVTTRFELPRFLTNRERTRSRACSSLPSLVSLRSGALRARAAAEPAPAFQSVTAFAPATVANLGPGFDFLGCAVADASLSLGDTVTATLDPTLLPGTVSIASVTFPSRPHLAARLCKDPLRNCAGVAAIAALRALGVRSHAVSIQLTKGLPLGSGLGSSAASAAAAAKAVDALFGSRLGRDDLVLAGLESEKAVSGFHADNIAPAILGGFVLVRSYEPFILVPLASPPGLRLHLVLVTPEFEAPTSKMRAALPKQVGVQQHVRNSSQAAALVAGVLQGDAGLIGSAMSSDGIVEPSRAPLIPGMAAVKAAALQAGALGCTISGAGPTAVAVIDGEEKGEEVGGRMVDAFWSAGKLRATATVAQLDRFGARVIATSAYLG